jgi:hypothetical protein
MVNLKRAQFLNIVPFVFAALGWLVVSQWICRELSVGTENSALAAQWALGLWLLAVVDLAVLGKTISCVLFLMHSTSEMRSAHVVQALCWGLFKVVCLGLFIIILLKGQKIPMRGLLLGMGTLVIVPLTGGFFWSQRVLRNA